jgi:microsomal dipeptidase-like Zn-dependent dipeptidase
VGGYFKQTPRFAGPEVIAELAQVLLDSGWSVPDLQGFLGENWLRVMGQVW